MIPAFVYGTIVTWLSVSPLDFAADFKFYKCDATKGEVVDYNIESRWQNCKDKITYTVRFNCDSPKLYTIDICEDELKRTEWK